MPVYPLGRPAALVARQAARVGSPEYLLHGLLGRQGRLIRHCRHTHGRHAGGHARRYTSARHALRQVVRANHAAVSLAHDATLLAGHRGVHEPPSSAGARVTGHEPLDRVVGFAWGAADRAGHVHVALVRADGLVVSAATAVNHGATVGLHGDLAALLEGT